MLLLIAGTLLIICIYLLIYQFRSKFGLEPVSLPTQVFEEDKLGINLTQGEYTFPAHKTWSPLSRKFRSWEERFPPISGFKRRLIKAGLPIGILEFFALKVLSLTLIPVVGFIFLGNSFPKNIVMIASLVIGYLLPELWLNKKIRKRQHNIRKDLPNIIDLLNLCVSGGLDFMLAVNRVVKDLRPCDLTQELAEVYHQTQMGTTRREALKHFAWRTDMPEVHSFVRTLIQADRMGSPLAEALKLQSEEMRVRRFQRGEAQALKAPIKLLFPLFAFILPVVLILVGGPILLQFTRGSLGVNF